jgi:ubiquitin carboxyl-terminal hydrolase 5/13
LDHFQETAEKYPLVVKLGTITTEGSVVHADCYSYANDEDGPVKIPNLGDLCRARGIEILGLQKTEKSTAELEVELNANYAFDAITESGSKLVSISGPGFQGLVNLGNTCYCNSVVQVLSALPEMANRYGIKPNADVYDHRFFEGISPSSAPNDLLVQTSKLVGALTSGVYAIPEEELGTEGPTDPKYRIAPRMFKHLIGKDHVDFRTGQQQDAAQFLQYFLEQVDRAEAKLDRDLISISNLFSFKTLSRIVCNTDKKVKYKDSAAETIWSLRVPMEKAEVLSIDPESKEEPEQKKQKQEGEDNKDIPTVTFSQCLDSWSSETIIENLRWPHLQNAVHPATETTRFKNFPRYLWVQIQRYQLGPDWQPFKLEVNLDIPETIDLSNYKAMGPQEDESLVPEEKEGDVSGDAETQPEISEAALGQLMDMGFSMNGCKRALTAVGGSDTEAAMNWIFEHNMDHDFNDPLPELSDAIPSKSNGDGIDETVVNSLVENLGMFTIDQVRAALKETDGAADRAADWLFSHMDDLDGAIANLQGDSVTGSPGQGSAQKFELEDGEGKYDMVGMISHIGKNTGSGHYVAHIKSKVNGKWAIFNDEKVALSESPPIQHAYLYLFQRSDTFEHPNPRY